MITAELLKLRRSAIWVVVIAVPLLSVILGAANWAMNRDVLGAHWKDYWSQPTLFYALFFLSLGIGALAALSWRIDRRANAWNVTLLTGVAPWRIIGAKIAALAILVGITQTTLVMLALVFGAFLGARGPLPLEQLPLILVVVVGSLPATALAALASLVIESFAGAMAVSLTGCVVSLGAISQLSSNWVALIPQALLTRTVTLGSVAVESAGQIALSDIASIMGFSCLGLTFWWILATLLVTRTLVK